MIGVTAVSISKRLKSIGSPERARLSLRFFKTGVGQYGEGDRFLGIRVPELRVIAKEHRDLPYDEVGKLLADPYHEARLTGLLILTYRFERADSKDRPFSEKGRSLRKEIYEFLLAHRAAMNNWDLVDVTVPRIIGGYLAGEETVDASKKKSRSDSWIPVRQLADRDDRAQTAKRRNILYQFAKSENLWERRIAIVSTLGFIVRNDFEGTLAIAEMLISDRHDLIHKATGWMLREVGKRDGAMLRNFLERHAAVMPRTMLRYAIERFPEAERRKFLKM